MTKYFCDICDAEVTPRNSPTGGHVSATRLGTEVRTAQGGVLHIEVLETFNGVSNAGHFCKYCLLDALAKLDDRPRPA